MGKNNAQVSVIRRWDLVKIFFRSFLIQASWNYKGMLNLGFLFTISPGLFRLYPSKEDRLKASVRHLGFFNTHPYLASYAIGATLAAEEEAIDKEYDDHEEVSRLKRSLSGPLGSLGDTIFWSRWRPVCAIIGILGAYLWGVWGPIMFLVLYNIPHLSVRFWGLFSSFKDRWSFINELSGPLYQTVPALGERMGAFFMGCLVVIFIGYHGSFDLATRSIFLVGLLITFFFLRRFRRFQVLHGTIFILFVVFTLPGALNWLR